MLLRGPPGVGKSRLARWLVERARETGVAADLYATGEAEGLDALVTRWARSGGLPADDAWARAMRLAAEHGVDDPVEGATLARMCAGEDVGRAQRHALARRIVSVAARPRGAAVVWLDDVHASADVLEWVGDRLAEPDAVPALYVLVARDDLLGEAPAAARAWGRLATRRETLALDVGDLPADATAGLVRSLLSLEPGLLARVVARTGGNPLFALQLLGDWVERGILRADPGGHRLADGADDTIPADFGAVWAARLDPLLEGLRPDAREALEIAAALGRRVTWTAWRGACGRAGVTADRAIVERLAAHHLARPVSGGWAFVHAMVRESLERAAADAGRLRAHHRACAEWLADHDGDLARLGLHLCGAGDPAAALEPLADAVRRRLFRGERGEALALLGHLDRALDAAAVPDRDPRREEAAGWRDRLRREDPPTAG